MRGDFREIHFFLKCLSISNENNKISIFCPKFSIILMTRMLQKSQRNQKFLFKIICMKIVR